MVRGVMREILYCLFSCIVLISNVVSLEQPDTSTVIQPSNSSGLPLITFISPDQSKINQGPADFSCEVENVAGYDVIWKRTIENSDSKVEIISTNTTINISGGKFSVSFDDAKSSFNLHLNEVQPNDGGIYICEISANNTPLISRNTSLVLQAVPKFFSNSSASPITVTVGSYVKIECYADGSPQPEVLIMRDNEVPLRDNRPFFKGNVLEIKNITEIEGGEYRCIANSSAGSVAKSIQVEVQGPPIIGSCSLKVVYFPEFNVVLECLVQSHDKPDIVWFVNEKMFLSSDAGSNFETVVSSDGKVSTATLKMNSTLNTGQICYRIYANNSLGKDEAMFGQCSSIPSCPPPKCPSFDCPSCSCTVSIFFSVLFSIIILGIGVYGFMNKELIRNFQYERNRRFIRLL